MFNSAWMENIYSLVETTEPYVFGRPIQAPPSGMRQPYSLIRHVCTAIRAGPPKPRHRPRNRVLHDQMGSTRAADDWLKNRKTGTLPDDEHPQELWDTPNDRQLWEIETDDDAWMLVYDGGCLLKTPKGVQWIDGAGKRTLLLNTERAQQRRLYNGHWSHSQTPFRHTV